MEADALLHCGSLLYQRSTFPVRRWERRFAELRFESPGVAPVLCMRAEDGSSLTLSLDGAAVGPLPAGELHASAACFFLRRKGRSWLFGCDSEAASLAWLEALSEAARGHWLSQARAQASPPASPAWASSPATTGQSGLSGPASPLSALKAGLGPRQDELAALAASPAREGEAAQRDVIGLAALDESTADMVALNAVWRDIVTAKDAALAEAAAQAEVRGPPPCLAAFAAGLSASPFHCSDADRSTALTRWPRSAGAGWGAR